MELGTMRAEAYYDRGNGYERVATEYGINSPSEMFDLCQRGRARTSARLKENDERSMSVGDLIRFSDETWRVDAMGFTEVEVVEEAGKVIDEVKSLEVA